MVAEVLAPTGANRFWNRGDVKAARRFLDIWSSQKYHAVRMVTPDHKYKLKKGEHVYIQSGKTVLHGDASVISADHVREAKVPFSRTSFAPQVRGGMRFESEVTMIVDEAIKDFAESPLEAMVLYGLLLWLYPLSGPYQSTRYVQSYRPATWVAERRKGWQGRNFQRHLDDELNKRHRRFITHLIGQMKAFQN